MLTGIETHKIIYFPNSGSIYQPEEYVDKLYDPFWLLKENLNTEEDGLKSVDYNDVQLVEKNRDYIRDDLIMYQTAETFDLNFIWEGEAILPAIPPAYKTEEVVEAAEEGEVTQEIGVDMIVSYFLQEKEGYWYLVGFYDEIIDSRTKEIR